VRTHTRISGIDPGHKRLWIGEESVIYRDLILAWGAETVRVPIEGDAADCVFPINDLEDYARFRAAAAGKRRVLLLGAGLIGCEFANDLSLGGYEVQLVAPCEQVMPTLLHPAAAAAVQADWKRICPMARSSRATWWSRPLACARALIWPPLPACKSIAAWWSTVTCKPPTPTSTPWVTAPRSMG
jgi:NADH dehydrogenase FAD-containing subunit